jgi:O-antigen/teichoic acid export membrane protein
MLTKLSSYIRSKIAALDDNIRDVILTGSIAFVLRVTGAGLSFSVNIILARLLGAEGAGTYYLALTVTSIASIIGRVGLDNTLMRFGSTFASQGEWGKVQSTHRRGLTISIIVSVAAAAGISWGSELFAVRVFETSALTQPLRIMAWSIPAVALISLYTHLLKGIDEVKRAMLLQGFGVPFLSIPLLLIFLREYGVVGAAAIYLTSAICVVGVGAYFWYTCTPKVEKTQEAETRRYISYRVLLQSSLPLLVVTSMNKVIRWTDTILLGMWESASTVGIYEIAIKTSMLTNFVLLAVNSVAAPKFASLYAHGESQELESLLQKVTLLVTLLVAPIVVVFVWVPENILTIFGTQFSTGSAVLTILVLGQFVNVATGSVMYVLMMTGHERIARNVTGLGAAANLLFNLILVPMYGMYGAAVATSLSIVLMNLTAVYAVYRTLSIISIPVSLLKP